MNPTIIFKEQVYPMRFSFRVIEKWENEAGLKISQIGTIMQGEVGTKELGMMLTLAYLAIESGLKNEGKPIDFTFDDFADGLEFSDLQMVMEVITAGISPNSENNRQPKGKPKK